MPRDRVTRPHWTHFVGGVIANGKNEIHRRRIGFCKLIPTLTAKSFRRRAKKFDLPQRLRTNDTGWMAPCTIGGEGGAALSIENSLSHDRACRITRTEK